MDWRESFGEEDARRWAEAFAGQVVVDRDGERIRAAGACPRCGHQFSFDIADEGVSHPCYRDLGRLDNCNDATCDKHHGDDAIVLVKRGVDPDGLRVIAADALELIGARRPAATTPMTRPAPAVTALAP